MQGSMTYAMNYVWVRTQANGSGMVACDGRQKNGLRSHHTAIGHATAT